MGILSTVRARFGAIFATSPARAAGPVGSGHTGGWSGVVREPFTGAWQQNAEPVTLESALSNPTVFRCVSLISGDIGKTPLRLVQVDANGIWTETTSPAFSPVLRKPNRYQTWQQFVEQWVSSKLAYGNTYVLKDRDARGVVMAMYVLDPTRVTPLIAPDGSVYYQVDASDLAGIAETITPPAREIIHDRWNCFFHPLVGLAPLYACGGAALEGNLIQSASAEFFSKGGRPSGVLMAPTEIDIESAKRLSAEWHALGPGKTAVVDRGMTYKDIGGSAVDAQLVEQHKTTVATIAGTYGVPVSYVDSTQQPPYANSEATQRQYHAQCLQVHMTAIEALLDEGLELPAPYGTEFDLDALIWMDTETRVKAAREAIQSGAMTINEARRKYFGLPPVEGGDTVYLQQQMYSAAALNKRDANDPFGKPAPAGPPANPTDEEVAAAIGDLAN